MAKVTSKDVAAAAGVSQTTVSFVLNGRREHGISDETRELVRATAERLGYVPSAAARSLRSGRSHLVLCLVSEVVIAEAQERFMLSMSAELASAGYACVFQLHAMNKPLADVWRHAGPDVIVALPKLAPEDAEAITRAGIALVDGIYTEETGPGAPNRLDQNAIGRMQLEHLAERGHRKIGVATIDDPRETMASLPRVKGVRERCRELGLDDPVVTVMEYTRDSAGAALHGWRKAAVTAVAAFNDLSALAILGAAATQGVRVPDDLALIGVDDLSIASLSAPALTTVAINFDLIAHIQAEEVLRLMNESVPLAEPVSGPMLRLVIREST
jgi:DNA-binding LacI/PurR family transcriptional regulator